MVKFLKQFLGEFLEGILEEVLGGILVEFLRNVGWFHGGNLEGVYGGFQEEFLVHPRKVPEGISRGFLIQILEKFQVDILVELKMEILE